jgi:assimilatory nitrate reductase catalytic subunit
MAETDTVRHAHVRLPATAWGEKDGTVTNSERRISRQRAFLAAPGEARPDWQIIAEVARRMGFAEAFSHVSQSEIFAEHAALSGFENEGARDFDIGAYAGVGGQDYAALAPFQWPQSIGSRPAQTRFFANGGYFTPDRKAKFVAVRQTAQTHTDRDFPLVLNTGRVRDHWHTMTRTGKSPRLSQHMAEPFVEIHPVDAARHGIGDADIVRVSTAHGEVLLRALVTARQRTGSIFAPMHWTDQFSARARVDALVAPITDAISGQPASKNVPARMERFEATAFGFAVLAERPASIDADYWSLARCATGWRLELALQASRDWTGFAASLFGADEQSETLTYHDVAGGHYRFACFAGSRLVGALYLAHEPVAVSRGWAAEQLNADHAGRRGRLAIVAGRPVGNRVDRGAIVCSCFGVGANQITEAVQRGCASVESIGAALHAGTNCGSCRAEIRIIIDARRVQAAE